MLVRLLLLCSIFVASTAHARELAVDMEDLVRVELASLGVVPITNSPVVLLREPDGGDIVPIFIGPAEARAIHLALQGVMPPRPMTHDLFSNVLQRLDATMESAIVDDLRDSTYHGALQLRLKGSDSSILIDARPSDAIALAARTGADILVAKKVLQSADDVPFDGLGDDDIVTALGITVVVATPDLREALNLPDDTGVLVSAVRGPAEAQGLAPGSLITAIDGHAPESPQHFLRIIRDSDADELKFEFSREGTSGAVKLPADLVVPREQSGEAL